jgi:DNA gyrase/topoisomerase IV subunit A
MARAGECSLQPGALLDLRILLPARVSDELLLLSSKGQGSVQRVAEMPDAAEPESWLAGERLPLDGSEWLSAATTTASPPRFRTVVSRKGFVRQFIRVSFDRSAELGQLVFESPIARDEPRAIVAGDTDDILVLTRWGSATRFPQRSIASQGSLSIQLEDGDEVAAAIALGDDLDIVIATASGRASLRHTAAIPTAPGPGAKGRPLMRAFDVLGAFPAVPGSCLMTISRSGRLAAAPVHDISRTRRAGPGQTMADLSHDPAVAVALLPNCLDLGE